MGIQIKNVIQSGSPSKQAQEVLYFNEAAKTDHPNVIFNGNTVQNSVNQKHLGLILDEKLTFNDHIASKLTTVNKLTSTLRKIYHYIPRNSLVTIYKSFVRLRLAYANVIFEKPIFLIKLDQLSAMLL